MPFQVSPGINVTEIDLTTIVPAVSTTEGVCVGDFRWGPCNRRILIDSEQELVRTFFKPNNRVATDWWSAWNFLAYGNKLYTVRVVDQNNANTALRAKNSTCSNSQGFLILNDEVYEQNYNDGELQTSHTVGPWVGKYPGALGNSLKVSVCPTANAYESTLTGTSNVSSNSSTVSGVGTNYSGQLVVGDLLVINQETHKIATITNTTSLTIRSRHVSGAVSNTVTRRWEFYPEVDSAPGTSIYTAELGGANDEIHVVVVDEDGQWTSQNNEILEVYQAVSVAADAKQFDGSTNYYKDVINVKSRYIRWASHDGTNTNAGNPAEGLVFNGDPKPRNNSMTGGSDGTSIGNDERIRGFDLFKSVEDVDISLILTNATNQTIGVYVINNIAEFRKDCVVLLSPPRAFVVDNEDNEADDIVNFRNTLPSTSYGVLDSGWKYQYDKFADFYRYLPLNPDIAGLMVRTDTTRDPWWSPAGLNRGQIKNVIKLAWNPRKADRDILYKSGINPVVTFPLEGTVLWGDKTMLAKPSAFDRINVRRLFIVLEKAISAAARYTLFEFNDEFTRAQFRNLVEPFLRDVQGRRGIFDFRVVCDETNNTPEVIDRNEFIGDIYIKPARSINFIQLNFVAVRTGVDFEEVVGKF